MKSIRRIIAAFAASAMLIFAMVPQMAFAGDDTTAYTATIDGLNFEFDQDAGTAMLIGCETQIDNLVVPSKVNGIPVTSIGDQAFLWNTTLTNVSIPSSVTSIGESAFDGCENLAVVTFDEGSNLQSIGKDAFWSCAIQSIDIPSSVTSIGDRAFTYCDSLKTVNILADSNLQTIGDMAFYGCDSLNYLWLPGNDSLTVGFYALSYSTAGIRDVYSDAWVRLAGDNRYETMAKITEVGFADGSCDSILLTSGTGYADGLSAAALAGRWDVPIITTDGTELSKEASEQISRLTSGYATVYILGAESAISESVENQVKAIDGVIGTERISGATRIDTCDAIYSRCAGYWGSDTAVIAYGWGFADALSIGPWCAASESPMFLVSDYGLTSNQVSEIKSAGFKNILVIGGPSVVNLDLVKSQLGNRTDGSSYRYTRLAGATRYETSREIVDWCTTGTGDECGFAPNTKLVFDCMAVATGLDYPDALTSVNIIGRTYSVLLLIDDSELTHNNIRSLVAPNSDSIRHGWILGGSSVVPPELESWLLEAMGN